MSNNIEFICIDCKDNKDNKEWWFDENVWSIIKGFAGYSNRYPIELPYYKLMLGSNYSRSDCITKQRINYKKQIKSLDDYMDRLNKKYIDYQDILIKQFKPRHYKSLNQLRKEKDEIHHEGWFDENFDWIYYEEVDRHLPTRRTNDDNTFKTYQSNIS